MARVARRRGARVEGGEVGGVPERPAGVHQRARTGPTPPSRRRTSARSPGRRRTPRRAPAHAAPMKWVTGPERAKERDPTRGTWRRWVRGPRGRRAGCAIAPRLLRRPRTATRRRRARPGRAARRRRRGTSRPRASAAARTDVAAAGDAHVLGQDDEVGRPARGRGTTRRAASSACAPRTTTSTSCRSRPALRAHRRQGPAQLLRAGWHWVSTITASAWRGPRASTSMASGTSRGARGREQALVQPEPEGAFGDRGHRPPPSRADACGASYGPPRSVLSLLDRCSGPPLNGR